MARTTILRAPLRWKARLVAAWQHSYEDARIIVERNSSLHYFHIPARLQQRLVRLALVSAGVTAATVVVLALSSLVMTLQTVQARAARREMLGVLRELDAESSSAPEGSSEWAREVVARTKQRQETIESLLEESTDALGDRNGDLSAQLRAVGIGDAQIKEFSRSLPVGGADVLPVDDALGSDDVASKVVRNRELMAVLGQLPTDMPLGDYAVSSRFGWRLHPVLGRAAQHLGVDLYSRPGEDSVVRAVADGIVKTAQYQGNYGNLVVLDHGGTLHTLYAHLSSFKVKAGTRVRRGDALGVVGSTGQATGTHLHFEVLVDGRRVDPQKVVSLARNVQEAKN